MRYGKWPTVTEDPLFLDRWKHQSDFAAGCPDNGCDLFFNPTAEVTTSQTVVHLHKCVWAIQVSDCDPVIPRNVDNLDKFSFLDFIREIIASKRRLKTPNVRIRILQKLLSCRDYAIRKPLPT